LGLLLLLLLHRQSPASAVVGIVALMVLLLHLSWISRPLPDGALHPLLLLRRWGHPKYRPLGRARRLHLLLLLLLIRMRRLTPSRRLLRL
jgi:hypothetical protein